jgi:alkyl hydroperoxide reductase subunit AhpC
MSESNWAAVPGEAVQAGPKLGQKVPDFEMTTYDPVTGDFGRVSLADQIARQRWTILFFYPADFTFV